jgi:ATP-dependent DNA helicase PIF1
VLQEQDSRQPYPKSEVSRQERNVDRPLRAEPLATDQARETLNYQNDSKQYQSNTESTPAISRGGLSASRKSISVKIDNGNLGDADGNIEFDVTDAEPELCKEQQEAVDYALSGRNVFMTGSGGCGKSVVVRHLLKKFRAQGKDVSIVAPTGIAAFQVSGTTTCTFMGWTQDTCREPFENVRRNLWKDKTKKRLKSTDVLIIDEISMVSNFHFERMSRAFAEIKGYHKQANLKPFGGCQVIAVGDFCQLPPIKGLEFCNECGVEMTRSLGRNTTYTCPDCPLPITYTEQDKWAFKSEAWAECQFANVHLTKIHRQSDEKFVQMLQKGRLGRKLVQAEIDLLMNHPCNVENGVWLSSRRKEVEDRNNSEFAKIKSEQHNYWCIDKFDCAHDDLRGTIKPVYWGKPPRERVPLDKLSEHRYSNCLSLKVGMPVILLKNVDVQAGLCNGSQGIVVGFEDYQKATPPSPPNDENYKGDEEGYRRAHRRYTETMNFMKHPGLDKQILPVVQFHNGMRCMIQPDCTISQLSAAEGRYSLLLRTQIPLAHGWALTIHKSQGMTLERLVVNLASVFEHGQAYVALSRATALEGLRIEGGHSALSALRTKLGPPEEVMEFLQEKFPHMFQS